MSYKVNKEVKRQAVSVWAMDDESTIEEVALIFGMSRSTLSRALAEEGYITLKRWKTDKENAMLEYLADHRVTSLDELKQLI